MSERLTPWPHWSEPILRWEAACFDSHGRQISGPVWIGTRNQERAVATAKYWMRCLGRKVRGTVVAKRYRPERDPEWQRGDWRVVVGDVASAAGSTS